MTKDEALDLALEALETYWGKAEHRRTKEDEYHAQEAITAIKQARSAPVQEPLEYWNAVEGWVKIDEVREHFDSVGCGTIYKNAGEDRVPLYTAAQRQWVGLTDEERTEIRREHYARTLPLMDAVEAKLKEKNT
jgi:hypothetical protein